jgi:hypothetical protein
VLQDPSTRVDDHRSNPAAVEHRRAGHFPPPHRRPTVSVSPVSTLLARRLPGPHQCSSVTPCRRRATVEPLASAPPHAQTSRGACALPRATRAVFPAGPSRQAAASRLFRPIARSRPPRPVGCSLGPVSAQYCATVFKCFSIVLNLRNCPKLQKFVETCRNVQNFQNKFCMNPLEPLFTVGLTKLTVAR